MKLLVGRTSCKFNAIFVLDDDFDVESIIVYDPEDNNSEIVSHEPDIISSESEMVLEVQHADIGYEEGGSCLFCSVK